MKRLLMAVMVVLLAGSSLMADEYVNGYTKRDGTYVNPYTRSSPDSSYNNNYEVRGNYNPSTGTQGSSSPTWNDKSPESNRNSYGSSGTIDNSYGSIGGTKKKGYGY